MPPAEPGYSDEGEIATTTLAEIYAQQGLYERALAIYRRIALRAPQDARIAERIEDLTRRLRGVGEGEDEAPEAAEPGLEIPIPVDEAGPGAAIAAWDAGSPEGAAADPVPGGPTIPVPEEEPARGTQGGERAPLAPELVRTNAPATRPGPLSDAKFAAWLERR